MANFMARNNVYSTGEREVRVRRARLLLAVAMWFGITLQAQANPIGAQIVSGAANINQAGNTLTITNSPNAIINWQGFSIGQSEITRFVQQNANSAVLNRVIGADPSQLLGTLSSNGRVFLVNPSGILVGQGARIDVAGLVASTLNLSDADFLSNNYNFVPTLNAAGVLNAGSIVTPQGGTVYLIAPQVENQGLITTPNGETILAAGNAVQLIDTATPGVSVQIAGSGNNAVNVGRILADSGRIGMVGALVRNSGELNASSLVSQGGRVFLKASQDAYVDKDATITAVGSTGGNIEVLGNRVAVMDNASLDASGQNGGGTVLVGGDYQGKNPDVQNAQNTFVGSNATIKADATDTGDGGKVIVWADDTTRAYGDISARGGVNGGDGGFVEVSGHRYLDFLGRVDTRAPQGTDGTLLLDPADITIDNSADNFGGGTFSAGVFSGATAVPSTLTWATINAQTGSLVINTAGAGGSGNININASGTVTGPSTLTLLANNNISIANTVAVSGGDFNLIAGWNNTGWAVTPGTGIINLGAGSSLSGNSLIFSAGNSITSSGLITANLLQVQSTGAVSLPGFNQVNTLAANVTAGTFSFENAAAGGLTIGSITSALGTVNGVAASGAITMRQYTSGGITVNQDVASSAGDVLLGIASGAGGITTNAIVSGLNTQVYTSGGGIAVNAGLTAATGTATLYSGAGAITTPTGLINANTIVLQSTGGSGAIGGDSLNPLRTSAIGGLGNSSTIAIGMGAPPQGPGAVYLRHTGDAVLTGVFTTGAAVPVNIEALGNLTATSINSGTAQLNLKAGNTLTIPGLTSLQSSSAISLTGDLINIETVTNPATINAGAGSVFITNTSASRNIDLGAKAALAGTLELSTNELNTITADLLKIGFLGTGNINISAAIAPANITTLSLYTLAGGVTQAAAGTISVPQLAVRAGANVVLDTAANLVANHLAGAVTNSANFSFKNAGALNVGTIAAESLSGISGAGVISLTSGGALTQSAGALLGGTSLYAGGSAVTLTEANPVGVISGAATAGDFVYNSASLLTVSNVAGVNGISVPADQIARNIRLSSDVGINQNAGSVIKANGTNGGGLALITAGPVFLDQANDVRTIAASLTGAGNGFLFANSENVVPGTVGDLVVGSVTAGGQAAVTGITTNGGDMNLDTPGLLTVLNPVSTGAGRVGFFGDDLILSNTVTSTSEVGISPYSANIPITVGAACGSPPCLSVTNLWQINAPTIGIGEDGSLGGGGANNPLAGAISVAGITTGGATLSDRHANTTRIGLFSGAGITQTGIINVQDLGVSAGTGVTLTGANMVSNLAGKTATGPFQFSNAQTFNIAVLSGGSGFSTYSMPGIRALSGDVALTANGATSDIVANSPENYSAIIATNGNVTLNAGRDVLIGNSGGTFADIFAYGAAKNASVTAARNILVDNFSFILSEAGNVSLTATGGNVSIRSSVNGSGSWIGAGTAGTGGIVTITAPAGSVLAPAPGYGGDVGGGHISTGTGGELVVTAYNGITLNGFNTVAGFSASNGIAGDVILNNSSSSLNILNILNPSGAVSVTNLGAIAVGVNGISAGGAVALTSGSAGSPTASDTITINGPVTGSSVTLAANSVTGTIPAGATVLTYTAPPALPPTVAECVVDPTIVGCTAVLPPLADCTLDPTLAGCTAVLPPLADCTLNPTLAGCTAVLPPLADCTLNPTLAGCTAVLPPLADCTLNPTLAGCTAVLPPLADCTLNPTLAGCTAVLPPLTDCTLNPTLAGCTAVLPPLADCTLNPTLAGCTAVLPPLADCTLNPTLAGCTAVLPPLADCTLNPTLAGCTAVLPPLADCTLNPALAGCAAVLPTVATCIQTPNAQGCTAVLPVVTACLATPTLPGCAAVQVVVAACTATPTLPGCALVLPVAVAPVQTVIEQQTSNVLSSTTAATNPDAGTSPNTLPIVNVPVPTNLPVGGPLPGQGPVTFGPQGGGTGGGVGQFAGPSSGSTGAGGSGGQTTGSDQNGQGNNGNNSSTPTEEEQDDDATPPAAVPAPAAC